uniref:ANK_REP_REGION domain-containing protein n=1 Tax=Macrostomum lignano TaxID=282301 RepID=A0A1I8HQZ1_9PLAT
QLGYEADQTKIYYSGQSMAANSQDSSNLEDGIDWNRLEELLSGGQASGNSVHRLLHAAVRRKRCPADSDGQTPLHLCVEYSCSDCLKLLLTAGARRSERRQSGRRDAAALGRRCHRLRRRRPSRLFASFLAGGADCNRVDCFGDNRCTELPGGEETPGRTPFEGPSAA